MYSYLLSVKHALRSVYFPVLLIVLALSLIASVPLGNSEELPTAGVCDLDGSVTSGRICAYLLDNHFVVCNDESDLRDLVASGKLNCGIVIPPDFESTLLTGDISGAVRFISSPASFLLPLYKNHAAAALFTEHAAVISANALNGTDIPREELIQTYREMMDEGLLFSFDIEYAASDADTSDLTSSTRARSYALSVASLIVFVMVTYSVCDLLAGDMQVLPCRIGVRRTVFHAILPHMAVRVAGILFATSTAAAVSFLWHGDTTVAELILPISLYTLSVSAAALLIAAIAADSSAVRVCTFFVVIASFALCPIYLDTALLSPVIHYIRPLCPTYWLWILAQSPAWALILIPAAPLSLLALFARFKAKEEKHA